ncbi:MAG: NAD(P)/FAD-dependent oxidoreductase [Clostridia bacterium]|nr:NAD(P)/FAD-dependent oxidoreductase [Clostridia bacterium]
MQKVVIVGAGVSGLSAGILALKKGFEVVIYEKNNQVGGNLTSWKRDNLVIDGCIHWLTGTNENSSTYKLWQEVGAFNEKEVLRLDRLFTNYYDGEKAVLYRDIDKTEQHLISLSKEDEKEIKTFILAVKKIQYLLGVGGENHDKKASILDVISFLPYLKKYYSLSLFNLAKRFKNKTIGGLFTNYIGGQFSSLALIITYANFTAGNADLIKGGSKIMADNILNTYLSLGGKIELNCGVKKANIVNGKVLSITLDNNKDVYLDYLIATGDTKFIYNNLLNVEMPSKLKKWYNNKDALLFSSMGIAFKVDKEKVPFLVDCSFNIPFKYKKELKILHLNLREYSYDDAFISNGKTIIQTLTFLNEQECLKFINLRKNLTQYKIEKERICNLYKNCIESVLPSLKGSIEVVDCWTPATYKRYNNSKIGSWMSFVVPKNTIPLKCSNLVKELSNVIVASQWLSAPGGLPICVEQGYLAVKNLTKLAKKQKTYKFKYQMANNNN